MLLHQKPNRRRRAAFTLMEMLIVVAIIVALAGVGGYFLMGALGGSQEDIASQNVKTTLTNACQAYYTKTNEWPESLQQLTTKENPAHMKFLEPDAIIDPWKKTYQYDKNGPNNGGEKPDIWTVSPPPKNLKIGNWTQLRQQ